MVSLGHSELRWLNTPFLVRFHYTRSVSVMDDNRLPAWYRYCCSENSGAQMETVKNLQHDDVIKWNHFLRYWPFVRGIHRSPVNSPYKGQWRGALIYAWTNGWVNNRDAGHLRGHDAHCDGTVMDWSRRDNCLIFLLSSSQIFYLNLKHRTISIHHCKPRAVMIPMPKWKQYSRISVQH